ncbi:GTP cyclohydrolase II [Legionella drozanskii]|uniref:GTP cyclohydrolase-2 n=1 Tax=Legionella drozanskii LLAP-1 TaxID=1212489 RepID=A0A0W0SN36_9GAMM|nr:GTP cyclohydrolase II [Legionella drozanskii]KTC84760.1 riboflavin biosynthesis protein RibA [Legionella drozanskii LLAP-1]
MENLLIIKKEVSASIPSKYGSFELSLFTTNRDNKEHLLLTYGAVHNTDDILVRIHSECMTGDILGSLRCDCGEQLQLSMSQIANEGRGIIIYLRQEGRGIGLIDKLRTYNLQDQGKDTVDANLALGHEDDARSYEVAAHILNELQIKSLRLLTNNPKKIEALNQYHFNVISRVPIKGIIHSHNAFYLLTKKQKMAHFFEEEELKELHEKCSTSVKNRPMVTLAYAQSLDGSISCHRKKRLMLSSQESLVLTHKLRSENDAILVGVGTVISDDPLLTVRHYQGKNPQVVILDSTLRIPLTARVLKNSSPPIIFTTERADREKLKLLTEMNAKIVLVDSICDGQVDLNKALEELLSIGIKTVMVEGGRTIITNFINENLVDKVIITVAPIFVGGISVLSKEIKENFGFPQLKNVLQYKLGNDIIIRADIERNLS